MIFTMSETDLYKTLTQEESPINRQAQEEKENQLRLELLEQLTPFISALKPIFSALKAVDLPFAAVRHLGILLTLFRFNSLTTLDEFPSEKILNDIDLLVAFDREKIIALAALLRSIPSVRNVRIELPETSQRLENPDGFLSQAFLTFEVLKDSSNPEGEFFKVEVFANYGLDENVSGRTVLFASLKPDGSVDQSTKNALHAVDFPLDTGTLQIPTMVGEGLADSYGWQDAVGVNKAVNQFDPHFLVAKPVNRKTLEKVAHFLVTTEGAELTAS